MPFEPHPKNWNTSPRVALAALSRTPSRATRAKRVAVETLLRQLVATLGYDKSEAATEWFLTQLNVATVAAIPAIHRSYKNNGPGYDCVGALADLLAASREPERHAKWLVTHWRRMKNEEAAHWRRAIKIVPSRKRGKSNG